MDVGKLRYWGLAVYGALSALVIFKDLVTEPQAIAALLAPIAVVLAADQIKHRNDETIA